MAMHGQQSGASHKSQFEGLLNVRQHLALSVLWFGLNIQSAALLPIVLPLQILLFVSPGEVGNAQQAAFLAWLSALGAIIALFIPPLVGALSDRTRGRFGRRRPYVALGGVVALAGAAALAFPRGVAFIVLGLLLFQIGNNVSTAGYQGLLPDLVPEVQRGEASGYMGIMTVLGNAGSLALAAVLVGNTTQRTLGSVVPFGAAVYYVATGVLLALTTLITLLRVHETPLAARVEGAGPDAPGFGERLTALWLEPWRHRDFTWVFLTRCAVMLGLSLYLTFIEYYFANVAGISNFAAETAVLSLLALLGASLSAFTLGLLSDRIGRVVVVCVSTVLMALASVAFVVLPAGVPLWPLGLVFGLGYGAYTSVDWALAVDVLPSREAAGKDMGLWSIASSLPSILAPVLGGAVIAATGFSGNTALGYRAVFALAVVFLLAGAVFILIVRDQVPGAIGKPRVRRPRRRPRVRLGWRLALGAGGGRARGFLRFWPVWERVTWLAHRPQPIPGAPYGVFLIVRRRHSGRPIELPDGTRVARGDMILELHANNQLLATAAETASPWELVRMMMGDLRALAAWAQTPAFPADVRAIFGVTLMGRAAGRLGFTLRERPRTLHARLERFFMMGLLVLYNPRGRRRLAQGMTYSTYPMEVWMSRGALLARYGGATRAE